MRGSSGSIYLSAVVKDFPLANFRDYGTLNLRSHRGRMGTGTFACMSRLEARVRAWQHQSTIDYEVDSSTKTPSVNDPDVEALLPGMHIDIGL